MVNFILVQLLAVLLISASSTFASMDKLHSRGYLGEKRLDEYHDRYFPLVHQDIYRGKISFQDDLFFQNYFDELLFSREGEFTSFLRSELDAGAGCSNEILSKHLDEIRYAYRLITLSYLLEAHWHMSSLADQLKLKKTCEFNLSDWAKKCRPKSAEMKTFISNVRRFNPTYKESFPDKYSTYEWLKELKNKKFQWYSHYRLDQSCRNCTSDKLPASFNKACSENSELMNLLCSEEDDVYGVSTQREAYYLLGRSNIVNTFNGAGEALGCLRRFSEVLSHKEVNYPALKSLFPPLHAFLKTRHGERFLQGRVFFFGSGKEFSQKGLADFYVEEQPLIVTKKQKKVEVAKAPATIETVEKKPVAPAQVEVKEAPKVSKAEMKTPIRSAFFQAAEVRASQNLDRMEVDMLKLKYDYIFSLHMINTLTERLKNFMTLAALREMVTFDKLGTKEGPVPLLFIKFMIDMEEHQGLWNLVNTLGPKFYVSNEIDVDLNPAPEYVELMNSEETGRQWQLSVIRPY